MLNTLRSLILKVLFQIELPPPNLTPAERRVYDLLQAGQTPKQIANTLHISLSTVKIHIRHIKLKTTHQWNKTKPNPNEAHQKET